MSNDWKWYLDALGGNRGPLTKGDPKTGYYRQGPDTAVAIWRQDQTLCCIKTVRSEGGTVRHYYPDDIDKIDETFGFACVNPITHEAYEAFVATAKWPEETGVPEAEEIAEDLPAHERAAAAIVALKSAYTDWLASIDGKINSDEDDAKAATFADRIGKIKSKAEDTRKTEKEPFLQGGRDVDARWKPIVDDADAAKKTFLAPTLDYRKRRAAEERAKREAEIARQRAEQAQQKDAGEMPAPVSMPPKRATGLRTVRVCEITDLQSLALQIAQMNDPPGEFLDACRIIARRLIEAGIQVKGARIVEEKRAA